MSLRDPVTGYTDPGMVVNTLAGIEDDMANRANEYEKAAGDRARLIRDWEKRMAISLRGANGGDANARKASALVTATETDDLYDRLTAAEDNYEACRVVMKVLETRAMIGMAILRSQGRA